ncbi:MAG: trypsin-like peptidase domain-containing protein [Putridiphycobacter sp.]|nr:trypsin-like peptidase domain-containing protein [Putridiphycobacter sp.]
MKNIVKIGLFGVLAIGGGFVGQQLSGHINLNNILDSKTGQTESTDNFIKPVNMVNESSVTNTFSDLTYASEQAVQAVAHIQTHFVREEMTYDPFMKLFYGQEAYKIRERHGQSAGSGVVISDDGYIVTNNHVVQDAKDIKVVLNDKSYVATLVGTDPSTDLALIKIDGFKLKHTEFGNSDQLKLGEWVLAVGNPLNLQSTVTAGIVSAKNRNIDLLASNYNPDKNVFPVESFIQTDAAVNSGNSGGALVNARGELIGINTAIASGTGFYTGYSFAIPSNIVKKVAYDLMTYGTVKRVQLGINLLENNSEVEKQYNLGTGKGVVIGNVIEGGNADKAGLKSMDVILAVENKKINSVAELQESIVLNNPGDKIVLKILRGDNEKLIEVMMAQ